MTNLPFSRWLECLGCSFLTLFLGLYTQAATSTNLPLAGTDTDGDGLPDVLEIQIGSSPTIVDTDRDGSSDFVEYFANTDPRDAKSFPLFLNSVPPRQYLIGDTILLRPQNVTNVITFTNIVVETMDVPPDPPVMTTNITLYPTFATYQWSRNGVNLSNQNSLELVLHQARTNESGLYRLFSAIDYITGFATNSGMNELGEITNSVVTNFARASQLGAPISVQILPITPRVRILQPAGGVVGWGNDVFKQATIPAALTNPVVLQSVGGRAHSAALLTNGTVAMWGTNDVGQLKIPAGLSNVVALASGLEHMLALKADGTVVAWGSNVYGQTNVPVALMGVRSIGAGFFHSLAVLNNGRVVAWGRNESGQTNVPNSATSIVQVVGGSSHSLALTTAGRVIAWGNTNSNRIAVPAAATNVVQIAAGDSHSSALLRDGRILVWGDNSAQQANIPGNLGKVLSVAAGDSYTAVVTSDGKVRVLGARGPLYVDGAEVVSKLPAGLTNATANAVSISSGFFHLLALVSPPDSDCDNLSDPFETQVGLQTTLLDTDADGLHDGNELRLGANPSNADSDGDGLTDLAEVADGFDPLIGTEAPDGGLGSSRAVQLDLFTLGRGSYQIQTSPDRINWVVLGEALTPTKGFTSVLADPAPGQRFFRLQGPPETPLTQLDQREAVGNNITFGASDAVTRAVPSNVSGLVQIAAGDWHTLGLRWDGRVVAWGINADGQINVPQGLTNVVAVAAGGQHSMALRADGSVVAWGRNHQGQTNVPANLPRVQAISAGSDFCVALLADNTVVAWGGNLSGQVNVPAGLNNVKAVAAGFAHVVALRQDGRVVCWGDNHFGQTSVPANLGTVIAIAAGDLHSIAVRSDGTVVCWGNNSVGQCSPPAGLGGVVKVAGGFRVSVALTSDGRIVAWGEGGDSLSAPPWFTKAALLSAGGFAIYAIKALDDADGDLVDDGYEVVKHTDPANADSDGDGLVDGLEFLYGFDPLVADAAPEPTVQVGPALKLTYFTVSTGQYKLESSTDLTNWTQLGATIANKRGFSQLLQAAGPESARFYRLTRVNP